MTDRAREQRPMQALVPTRECSATLTNRRYHFHAVLQHVLARNASSILSRLSHLPTKLSADSSSRYHQHPYRLSHPLVTALSSLSTTSVGCLSAPTHPNAPIAYSVAFFHMGKAMPFWSEIPGRPESQVGRWHAMRKKGDKESSLGWIELALLEEENVDWERVWSRSVASDARLRR